MYYAFTKQLTKQRMSNAISAHSFRIHQLRLCGIQVRNLCSSKFQHRDLNVRLYQSEASPPCVKIRALLHFFDQSYEIVRVSMPFKPEIRWSWYKKFPQCIINGQHVTDSPEIFRFLYPLLSGTEMTAQEIAIERDTITYGLMPALQLLMYQDRVSLARFMALATRDMGGVPSAAAAAAFFLAGPALPLASRLRRAHPDLRDAADYASDIARLLPEPAAPAPAAPAAGPGPFLLGAAAPGALDISLWGTLEPFARARCPVLLRGPLADARLRAWHGRMSAAMAARRPVFDP
jgi:hypothetical protein